MAMKQGAEIASLQRKLIAKDAEIQEEAQKRAIRHFSIRKILSILFNVIYKRLWIKWK